MTKTKKSADDRRSSGSGSSSSSSNTSSGSVTSSFSVSCAMKDLSKKTKTYKQSNSYFAAPDACQDTKSHCLLLNVRYGIN